jgi:peptidoglycan/xylan/chitin deacetylase (PgdA/CDA1 family)
MKRVFKRSVYALLVLAALFAVLFFSLPLPGTVPVLMYHFIGSDADALREGNFVSRESFAKQMAFLKVFNYRVLTMEEYAAIQSGKRKSQGREVLVTFDDGHRSFKRDGVPVLRKLGLPAVMFLISESVKKGGTEGYGDSMTLDEIKELQKIPGLSFQAHTKTHPHLKELSESEIETELTDSKRDLEAMLGHPVDYVSYPFGEMDRRIMAVTEKAGYHLAFSTSFKKLTDIPEGPFSLTRAKIGRSSDHPLVFWYHASGLHYFFKSIRQKIKYGV